MSSNVESELASFHHFVALKLSENDADLSPEDVLDLWRAEHPLMDEDDDAIAAVKEALAGMEAGDLGRPWEEFDREFRERHGLDSKP
ncbi:MAG TPA: hypothetical protein VGY55_16180 [Pirellulales bacterium]|jgi:hypothetical protein|nr:hypothetical protein [Pirellulales bacterium]